VIFNDRGNIFGDPHDKYAGMIFTVNLKISDGVSTDDVEKVLRNTIFQKNMINIGE